MQFLLFSIPYLRAIFMSRRHLIAWVSKVTFIINRSAWACKFVPPLCCQQPSSCIRCIRYAAFSCCSWCCSLWCCCCHILMSLSMNNLMSLWVGKSIELNRLHPQVCSEWCLRLSSLETIGPILLRGRWTHMILGDMAYLVTYWWCWGMMLLYDDMLGSHISWLMNEKICCYATKDPYAFDEHILRFSLLRERESWPWWVKRMSW